MLAFIKLGEHLLHRAVDIQIHNLFGLNDLRQFDGLFNEVVFVIVDDELQLNIF
jgi:hypothetical protein